MCGILGSNQSFSKNDIKDGLKKIKYRGPDETIISEYGNFILGMNRLSIRDLQKNLYPFKYKHLNLIINGEIYNLAELKKYIPKFKFQTKCDAEIILPLFDKFNVKTFDLLSGMFALSIYDSKNHILYLARDKFGEKPLYYYHKQNSFFFGSEISAFPKKIKNINKKSIPKFLTFGFIPDNETFFEHIYKLKPGQYLQFDTSNNKLSIDSYISQTKFFTNNNNLKTTINKLDTDLKNIISSKLISDVPIGIFLSGGVDSSLLTAICQKNSENPMHTFSIGFKEKSIDESKYSLAVSKILKTNHHHIIISGKDIKNNWIKVVGNLDEPISDPAIFPTYILSKKASKYVKVIISGEGADEIFGGYNQYQVENYLNNFPLPKIPVFQKISLLFHNQRYWKVLTKFSSHYTQTIYHILWNGSLKNKILFQNLIEESWYKFQKILKNNLNIPESIQHYDLNNYLAEQLCMKVDKMTMKSSIESRAPFLDYKLLPFLKISSDLIRANYPNKYLLRSVAQKYLPKKIAWRKKHGFSLPLKKWIKSNLKTEIESLKTPHPYLLETISQKTINKLIHEFYTSGTNELSIWNLITLNSWLKINRY